MGEGRALRLARVVGYRRQAWDRLQRALRLETPAKDKEQLRQEAVACLGDFVGLEPTTWEDFPTGISCAALHPEGTQLATGLVDGTVLLRRIPTGAPIAKLTEHRSAVSSLTFRADGKELVSTERAGKIKVWQPNDTGTWTCRKTIPIEPTLVCLSPSLAFPYFTPTFTERSIDWATLTPDGRYVAVPFLKESTIVLVDLADGTPAARFRAPKDEKIQCMAFSPDGKLLAGGYAHNDGTSGVLVWDVATRGLKKSLLSEREQATAVKFSPDGKLLACVHHQGIALYDTSTFQHRQFVREIAGTSFGPSDFDKTTDQDRLLGHGDRPAFIAFSPDSQVIAIYAFQLGLIRLWNIFTNREVA